MSGSIPFSTFVDITSSTITPAATFGRLNALCITTSNDASLPQYEEFSTSQDVISRFGVNSSQANYATEFFSYTSKTATSPQKLTFYNWRNNGTPITVKGSAISDLSAIKVNGVIRSKLGESINYTPCDLSGAVNFVDAASKIKDALKTTYASNDVDVNYVDGAFIVCIKSDDTFEFLTDEQETITIYSGDITQDATDITPHVDIVEAGNFTFNASKITSTSTASTTLKVSINNEIDIFSAEVNDVKNTPLNSQTQTTPRIASEELSCSSLNVTPSEYSFEGVTIQFTQNESSDLSTLCGLTLAAGAKIVNSTEPEKLDDAINNICINNGDYVTISFDSAAYSAINVINDISVIMNIIKTYAVNRYYLVCLFSDDDISKFKELGNIPSWEEVQNYEGLIAIRGTNTLLMSFAQAIIASIDYTAAGGATNINFIDAPQFSNDAITTVAQLNSANDDRVNTAYITGGYGQQITLFGEGHIMGSTFKTLSVALGETYIKAQMEVQGINILNGNNLISLRGKGGQGQVIAVFSSILNDGVTSGIIVRGATLTTSEKSLAASATGVPDIYTQLESSGWYIRIDTITDENIANKTLPITYVYVANTPVNRIQVRSFIIGA